MSYAPLFTLFTVFSAAAAPAATFIVDTTSDVSMSACTTAPGDCSLRGAVAAANLAAGFDIINFDIPMSDANCVAATGVCTITPATAGLVVFGGGSAGPGALIDGSTQPGWQANTLTPAQGGLNTRLKIVLSGSACPNCAALNLANVGSAVRGLVISGFMRGVTVEASDVVIEGNFIGTDVTGSSAVPNSQIGIALGGNPIGGEGATFNVRIGGTLPAQRNLVSGNSDAGMKLAGFGTRVLGNLVGTNAAGNAAIANGDGLFATGGANAAAAFRFVIGDGTPAGRNVISGNSVNGILFSTGPNGLTRDSRVQGNYIGTDVGGVAPLGNAQIGIRQELTVPNLAPGLAVQIGGSLADDGNRIRFNGGAGILVPANRQRTSILGNHLGGNGRLGVSLGAAARLPNDAGDADDATAGGNRGQNFPQISAAVVKATTVDLSYRIDSTTANSAYPLQVEFFTADGDEGRDLIGVDTYTSAEAQAVKPITLSIPASLALGPDDVIVASATDAEGNTSEFSFAPATLAIDVPESSACVSDDSVFCNGFEQTASALRVRVRAVASAGPFKPNGRVNVSDNRGASCSLMLRPTATALTSEGACFLIGSGAPGPVTITATLDTFSSAFGTAAGGSPTTFGNFIVP